MWAVIDNKTGRATPVSNTERGAKSYATRNGYSWVGKVCNFSWVVTCTSMKIAKGWKYTYFSIDG